ncbi:molybdenum cofactor synthesis protein [Halovivax asiaticus JCM 14624]|uniref:Molybdenum cofactor synthesis protein n=1 Tax=Halovivax asiaticus JCM 14624 TaxID=1227490 RepID=M0BRH2_9EURY|nr:gephyrin-like molybdotransferase Glp [Halovivax asiaticus]ELZ13515.1 molybdenum cofactor synthesis protein [Halovivax asiaticus JCM 14624]
MNNPEAGLHSVTSFEDGYKQLRSICHSHERRERRPVTDANGAVLASAVRAARAVPHYDRAAMDGFAVRARDTFDASGRSPARLTVDTGHVATGTASAVHTGSAVPEGADAVVPVEATERREGTLLVTDAVTVGENVADAGEDVAADESLFDGGHRLRPADLALLRAAGVNHVEVVPSPTVSVVPTGEELVDPDVDPKPGQVVETNGLMVSSLLEQWGSVPTYRDPVTDDNDRLQTAIERDLDHDIVVTLGGSSVGERDLVPDVVDEIGEGRVHGLSIKPGHPMGFGTVEETPVLFLPGYPVSCLVTATQFLRPAVAWSIGREPADLPAVRAKLGAKLPSEPGERTFARVKWTDAPPTADGLPRVHPVRTGGAGVLSSVTRADGWVIVPESLEGIPAGEPVDVELWERPDSIPITT